MKIKAILITLTLILGVFTACTDKKKKEQKPEIEITTKESKTNILDQQEKAAKRTLDSIKQVKEHGHAH